jgi:DNA-binding transcriptional ArsR family regulator
MSGAPKASRAAGLWLEIHEAAGLTDAERTILAAAVALTSAAAKSQKRIADEIGACRSTAVRVIGRLLELGLLERQDDGPVQITQSGIAAWRSGRIVGDRIPMRFARAVIQSAAGRGGRSHAWQRVALAAVIHRQSSRSYLPSAADLARDAGLLASDADEKTIDAAKRRVERHVAALKAAGLLTSEKVVRPGARGGINLRRRVLVLDSSPMAAPSERGGCPPTSVRSVHQRRDAVSTSVGISPEVPPEHPPERCRGIAPRSGAGTGERREPRGRNRQYDPAPDQLAALANVATDHARACGEELRMETPKPLLVAFFRRNLRDGVRPKEAIELARECSRTLLHDEKRGGVGALIAHLKSPARLNDTLVRSERRRPRGPRTVVVGNVRNLVAEFVADVGAKRKSVQEELAEADAAWHNRMGVLG